LALAACTKSAGLSQGRDSRAEGPQLRSNKNIRICTRSRVLYAASNGPDFIVSTIAREWHDE